MSLSELNLDRNDYQVLNTVTAEATISYTENAGGTNRVIKCDDEDFALQYLQSKEGWICRYRGIVKLGYLANDYSVAKDILHPEEVARRLAIYRIINMVQQEGADGVIEPIVSTNVDNGLGKNEVIFKTTVRAKLVKLKTDK
ncbi:MAG: hypothetical protein IJ348_07200 [Alistipes sp.]|nr:hypothetical protein [Alistipes sp.]